jgi:hypothetical protein
VGQDGTGFIGLPVREKVTFFFHGAAMVGGRNALLYYNIEN